MFWYLKYLEKYKKGFGYMLGERKMKKKKKLLRKIVKEPLKIPSEGNFF